MKRRNEFHGVTDAVEEIRIAEVMCCAPAHLRRTSSSTTSRLTIRKTPL